MSEQLTIDGENVVCTHELVIRIHQMEDGSVLWNVRPDEAVFRTCDYDVWGLAEGPMRRCLGLATMTCGG
jgi:hypothetical protein